MSNLCLLTDSYKPSHYRQYPPGVSHVYSFFESRGGRWPETVFFGLQYYLLSYLQHAPSLNDVDRAAKFFQAHFGQEIFNTAGWDRVAVKGYLPIKIKAVREGIVVPTGNVLFTVENTEPGFEWLTNYIESLLVQVWYPMTVATQSREMKKILLAGLERTGDPSLIDFKLHDFGFRGSTSVESSAIGGAAHLVNFKGSDTVSAMVLLQDFYDEPMAGFSIPAAEHSTITSWGPDGECDAFANMLDRFPTGIVAVVSDSYDIRRAVSQYWGKKLRERVLARDGVLVIRPDSGDPVPVILDILTSLGNDFGVAKNDKGYKVLHPKVRVIQGDGIDYAMLDEIVTAMIGRQWSIDNIAFGSGGGLLQKVNRDTQRCALKCSQVTFEDGTTRDVMKSPVTDPSKRSKAGRLALIRTVEGFQTVPAYSVPSQDEDQLQIVFLDGKVTVRQKLSEIRERAAMAPEAVAV